MYIHSPYLCIQPHQTLIITYMMHHLRTRCLYVAVWEVALSDEGLMRPGSRAMYLGGWPGSLKWRWFIRVQVYSPVPLNHFWFAFYAFIVSMGTLIIIIINIDSLIDYLFILYVESKLKLRKSGIILREYPDRICSQCSLHLMHLT